MNAVEDSIAGYIYYHPSYQTFLKHMFYFGILPVAFLQGSSQFIHVLHTCIFCNNCVTILGKLLINNPQIIQW